MACATLGLDLTRTKVAVFALSAAIAGLAGAVSGQTLHHRRAAASRLSFPVTTLAVVGGVGADRRRAHRRHHARRVPGR